MPNVTSKDELFDIAIKLYRVCKHSLILPCHHPETEEVVHTNMRMGIGLTGILQSSKEQLSWLSDCYEMLRAYDKEYSKKHNMNISIKLTTVKPSGTLSLLPGVTPGVHPGYAQYMIRRITIATDHVLVKVCRKHGYPMEYKKNFDGSEDYNSMIVSFPFSYPEGTILANQMTAVEQLGWIKRMQADWSDNSVSCTVYYRKEELPEIKEFLLKNYTQCYKSLSFLLHSEHGFQQAPYEEIGKAEFDELVSKTQIITHVDSAEFDAADECASGACPVR